MVFIVISLLGYYLYQTLIILYHQFKSSHKDESFSTKIITLGPCIEKLPTMNNTQIISKRPYIVNASVCVHMSY